MLMFSTGFRTNAMIMEMQMVDFVSNFGDNVQFFFPEAPHAASGPGDPGFDSVRAELREWWHCPSTGQHGELPYLTSWNAEGDCVGMAESVNFLREFVQEQMGGEVDVIIGFSQGAAVAKHLFATTPSIPAACLFSPVRYHGHDKHAAEVARWRHNENGPEAGRSNRTAFCCYDRGDLFVSEVKEIMDEIRQQCPDAVQSFTTHEEGHVIPRARASPQAFEAACKHIADALSPR
jgi:poly(3-hydroxybutyrate) depolymerase